MAAESGTRKLVAILSADAAAFSRLMQADETATVAALDESRSIFRSCVGSNGGRVVDMAGDSVLAAFETATGAVSAALACQDQWSQRNEPLPESRRMRFRIGVNLGEIVEKPDGTVYGDGVNIAARLQTIAEPGAVTVSGSVFEQVEGKLPVSFEYAGEQTVKNISKPIRAYRLVRELPSRSPPPKPTGARFRLVLSVATSVLLIAGAAALWKLHSAPGTPPAGAGAELSQGPKQPEGPSIAVLPFTNLSADPKQEYFADGMTEDLITALSKIERLLVISRNSTFQYKGKAVDVRQVSRELGVRHVLEGSVQKEGNVVRFTAQLIDATSGAHVWSERYDRPLKDIFAVHDELTRGIVAALDVRMVEGEQARVWRRTTNNVEAYEHFLRGREYILRFSKEDLALAERELQQAIQLDPKFALAYTQLTSVPLLSVILGYSEHPKQDLQRAFAIQWKGIELDNSVGYSYTQIGRIYMQQREIDKALEYGKKGVTLEPNSGSANSVYAHILEAAGRPEESLAYINRALRLSAVPESWVPWLQGNRLRQLGRYDEAIAAYKHSIALAPKYLRPHVFLVDAYVAAGRMDEAKAKAQEVRQMCPDVSVDAFLGLFV